MERHASERLARFEDLVPQGELDLRLRKSISRVNMIPRSRLVEDLSHPDRPFNYGADFAGRWLELMSIASRLPTYRHCDFGIREAVAELCRFQRPETACWEGSKTNRTMVGCAPRVVYWA